MGLLYIKCQDLKKRFSIKLNIVTLLMAEFLSLQIKKKRLNFFYHLFPVVDVNTFEKYYVTFYFHLKVSNPKSYKTI